MTSESLGWKSDETRFPLEGRIQFAQPSETNWKRPFTGKMTQVHASIAVLATEELPEVKAGNKELIFPTDANVIKDAYLVLFRQDKSNSKPAQIRVSLFK